MVNGAVIVIYPGEKNKTIELFGVISLLLLILLCLTGAIMGIFMTFGKLKKMPFLLQLRTSEREYKRWHVDRAY